MTDAVPKPKRKRGRPPKPKPAPDAPAELPETVAPPEGSKAVIEKWAGDVMWAYENNSLSRLSQKKAGSKARHSLWQFGKDNPKELLVRLVPQAMAHMAKMDASAESEAIEAAEEKSIAELRELLKGAIEESKEEASG